ncbi:hypothetical protein BX070DRAFT_255404 [Coemansia spiralis]|nr:hypothetical protein BX070DRAFT_255404 [Coemansia spiralis]
MRRTLHDLWCILTLAPEKLGHICAVDGIEKQITVKAKNDNVFVTSINAEDSARDGKVVLLNSRIKRLVDLFGRVAYLFRSQDKNPKDNLVAKIYGFRQTVTGVPEVLYYGTLKADFFGYRMEILLLEDCGTPIIDHLDNISTPQNFMKCANKLAKCAKEATSTLVHAYDAGILHRDISAGNINDVDIDMPNILQNEDEHGRFTGTPLYMSIQILRGFNMRGVTHDIKSLFMIVLHTLAVLNKSAEVTDDAKYGWKFLGSEIMAILRIGFFACSDTYLEKLGCPKLTVGLKKVVKSMYRFLFQDKDGIYIDGKLGNRLDYERGFKLGAAGGFLDDEVLAKLQFIQQNYAMQEMEVDMSSALPVPMPQAMQSKQIKLQAEASAPRASAARTLAPVAAAVPASYARARTLVVRTNIVKVPAPVAKTNIPRLPKRKLSSLENSEPLAQRPAQKSNNSNKMYSTSTNRQSFNRRLSKPSYSPANSRTTTN